MILKLVLTGIVSVACLTLFWWTGKDHWQHLLEKKQLLSKPMHEMITVKALEAGQATYKASLIMLMFASIGAIWEMQWLILVAGISFIFLSAITGLKVMRNSADHSSNRHET